MLASLEFWGNVAAIVAACVVVAGALGWVRGRWLLRNPAQATYLIPQAEYASRNYPGGPTEEQTPDSIVVSPGLYEVMHRVQATQGILLDSVRLEFAGPRTRLPRVQHPSEPMVVDTRLDSRGDREVLDWHGIWQSGRPLPRMLPKGEAWVVGHIVRAPGEWQGLARLTLTLRAEDSRASKTQEVDLSFRVDPEAENDLGFLRQGD